MNPFEGTKAEVRNYQLAAVAEIISLSKRDDIKNILVESPTGSGKTVMGLALVKHAASLNKRVGWCAMRKNLLTQAQEMNVQLGFNLSNISYVSMFDRNPGVDVDWLIIDEAHHDATQSMAHIHATVKPQLVIGLSATPFRNDQGNLAFEHVIKPASLYDLVNDGYLSRFDHFTVPNWDPISIAKTYISHKDRWGSSVIFFNTIRECTETMRVLQAHNVQTELVRAGSDRETQIENLKKGKTNVIVSMSILAEGFDFKELQSVFVRPASMGPTLQMAGRCLRKVKGVTKNIVQCTKTQYPFTRAARANNEYLLLNDEFKIIKKNENLDKIYADCAQLLAKIATKKKKDNFPDFLQKKRRFDRFQV